MARSGRKLGGYGHNKCYEDTCIYAFGHNQIKCSKVCVYLTMWNSLHFAHLHVLPTQVSYHSS